MYLLGNLLLALVLLVLLAIGVLGALLFAIAARDEKRNGNSWSFEAALVMVCLFIAYGGIYNLPATATKAYARMAVTPKEQSLTVVNVEHYTKRISVGQYDPGQVVPRTRFTCKEFGNYWFECGRSIQLEKGSKLRLKVYSTDNKVLTYDYPESNA